MEEKEPKDKGKETIMQRDKGQRDIVSVWLRGRPGCFVMPDCSAGSDGSDEHASFCSRAPLPLQGTSGDKRCMTHPT